jgi:hypothetical protein
MHEALAWLGEGDRRSIGNVKEVIAAVERDPSLFEVVFHGLLSEDALICIRAASSTEYCEPKKTIPTEETNSGQETV